jgi:hypothetical protein
MVLVSKEIDTYNSTKHEGRRVTEFIIYVMNGNTPIAAYTEIGEENRNNRLEQLLKEQMLKEELLKAQ